MTPFYEKRDKDFVFRDDRGGSIKLACSPHVHRHVEFAYMLEGCATGFADSGVCTIGAGDLFIAFPNQIHRFISTGPEKYLLFIVDPDMIPEFSHILLDTLPISPLLPTKQQPPQLRVLLEGLAEEARRGGDNTDSVLRGYLLVIFGEIFRHMPLEVTRTGDTQLLRSLMDYCVKNYTQPLSLDLLSEQLHLSKYYISHIFSDRLNIGFNDYVNSLRVSAACRQLTKSDMSVTEISEAVGFSTLRTFNRAFLRHMGVTPSAYRKSSGSSAPTPSLPS